MENIAQANELRFGRGSPSFPILPGQIQKVRSAPSTAVLPGQMPFVLVIGNKRCPSCFVVTLKCSFFFEMASSIWSAKTSALGDTPQVG